MIWGTPDAKKLVCLQGIPVNSKKIKYLAAPLGPFHGTLVFHGTPVENHWSRAMFAFFVCCTLTLPLRYLTAPLTSLIGSLNQGNMKKMAAPLALVHGTPVRNHCSGGKVFKLFYINSYNALVFFLAVIVNFELEFYNWKTLQYICISITILV